MLTQHTDKKYGEDLKKLREDILYYASDFPHWDHHFPHSMDEFEERPDMSESLRKWILRDTALRLYGQN